MRSAVAWGTRPGRVPSRREALRGHGTFKNMPTRGKAA
jgi:hypothetical protein